MLPENVYILVIFHSATLEICCMGFDATVAHVVFQPEQCGAPQLGIYNLFRIPKDLNLLKSTHQYNRLYNDIHVSIDAQQKRRTGHLA